MSGVLKERAGGESLIIYTDGRPTKVAFIVTQGLKPVISRTVNIPFSTNFEAEYRSIIEALKWLLEHKDRLNEEIVILNDNATVISQLCGKARIFEPRIKALYDEAKSYVVQLQRHISFEWIAKEENEAHALFKAP